MEEWVFNEEILNQSKTESKQGKYQILHSVGNCRFRWLKGHIHSNFDTSNK